MPFHFSIVAGPHVGQEFSIDDGQQIRVGRTTRSDYAFPADAFLSGAHFEIACSVGMCRVQDLGSANGTLLNGVQVTESELRDGDEIAAGQTTFKVRFIETIGAAPPATPVVAPATLPVGPAPDRTAKMQAVGFIAQQPAAGIELTSVQRRAEEILIGQPAPLFAVLDAGRDAALLPLIESSPLNGQPLHDLSVGGQAHDPYLVELGQTRSAADRAQARLFLQQLLHAGWGKNWGIFVTSLSHFEEVREHLRRLLLVADGGRPLRLRFYDLRVLPALLPVCEPEEIQAVFGPVISFLMESDQPDAIRAFSRGSQGLTTTTFHLRKASAGAQAG